MSGNICNFAVEKGERDADKEPTEVCKVAGVEEEPQARKPVCGRGAEGGGRPAACRVSAIYRIFDTRAGRGAGGDGGGAAAAQFPATSTGGVRGV